MDLNSDELRSRSLAKHQLYILSGAVCKSTIPESEFIVLKFLR